MGKDELQSKIHILSSGLVSGFRALSLRCREMSMLEEVKRWLKLSS